MTPKVLVSRCLLGHRVRYDGGASGPYAQLAQWQAEGRVIALCPEVAGACPRHALQLRSLVARASRCSRARLRSSPPKAKT